MILQEFVNRTENVGQKKCANGERKFRYFTADAAAALR